MIFKGFYLFPERGRTALLGRVSALVLWGVVGAVCPAGAALEPDSQAPVDFMADTLIHDDDRQMVIAMGHVEFSQAGRILRADEVSYDLTQDTVVARGNVALMETNGDVHTSEELKLSDDLRDGFVRNLRTTLADGSRFTAREGERRGGKVIEMRDATYTPCEPCKLNPDKPPVWQLSAERVVHDDEEKSITYRNATFDVYGVPVLYTPYFSHPDSSVKQKSGFLSPSFKTDSQNGMSAGTSYYWGMSPSQDATLAMEVYTKQAPRLSGEYRERLDHSELSLGGSATYSERQAERDGVSTTIDAKQRGHIEGQALWDMNDKWRSGFDFNVASDDQYFRQYDVTSDDVLENEVYVERFDARDYASGRLMAFQDLRTSDRATDQPNILPEIEANFLGDPGGFLGGRWNINTSFLALERGGNNPDMLRASLEAGWQGRYITPFGLVTTVDAALHGDSYYLHDLDSAVDANHDQARFYPVGQIETSLPLVKPMDTVTMLFEPIASVTVITNQDQDNGIPNEDSQDIQLDASNLFERSRFPGLDRVEDLSRVTYGTRTGLNWDDGSLVEGFIGQSYRFSDDDNPFPENSGLARQQSDIVGRLKLGYQHAVGLDYGFQLGNEDLESVRHELNNSLRLGAFSLNTRYLFAKEIEGIGIDSSREQIQSYAKYGLTDQWAVSGGANYDLSVNDGLRKGVFGLEYKGQCVTFSAAAQRNLTRDTTGESSTEVFFRVGLKNLGDFQTSGITLSRREQDTKRLKGIPVEP